MTSSRNVASERYEERADWALIAFGIWTIAGLFLDGWAHTERRPDSFFTPWHAVLYSGGVGMALVTAWRAQRQHPDATRRDLIVLADRPSLIGLALFGLGGLLDMAWHQVFGVEVNLEAVLSPTHLMLMVGGLLVLSAPLRRAWLSPAPTRLTAFMPALVSLGLVTGVAFFFTFFASPFGETVVPTFASVPAHVHDFSRASESRFAQIREMWALTGMLFTTALVVVPSVVLARRWSPPRGSFIVLFGFFALFVEAGSEFTNPAAAVAVLVAGVAAEACVMRRVSLPALTSIVAVVLWATYFAGIAATDGLRWSAELWSGTVVLSGGLAAALGLVASSLALPRVDAAPRRAAEHLVGGLS